MEKILLGNWTNSTNRHRKYSVKSGDALLSQKNDQLRFACVASCRILKEITEELSVVDQGLNTIAVYREIVVLWPLVDFDKEWSVKSCTKSYPDRPKVNNSSGKWK